MPKAELDLWEGPQHLRSCDDGATSLSQSNRNRIVD